MKAALLKAVALLGFLSTFTTAIASDDWRVDIFDRAQALVTAKNRRITALLTEAEPRLADWCSKAIAREEAKQRAERYGFVEAVRKRLAWAMSGKPADWVRGFDVMGQQADELAHADPVFDNILREYIARRRASGSMNPPSELYEPIREKLAERALEIEMEMQRDLEALQTEASKKMPNQ